MIDKRVVLIGTARNQYLRRSVTGLQTLGAKVFLLVKNDRLLQFADEKACVGSFHGNVTWRNSSLLRQIRSLNPDIVAFVVGDQFHHEKVSQALRFWKRIGVLPGADIYASLSHDPASLEYWGENANARLPAERSAQGRSGEDSHAEPWRRLCLPSLTEDPEYGWKNQRVEITAWLTEPSGDTRLWALNIGRNGARKTCAENVDDGAKKKIFLFGGDKTFGVGLSDEETFAWRLKTLFPSAQVRNHGVEGYDLGQIELVIPELIANEIPDLVFVEIPKQAEGMGGPVKESVENIISIFSGMKVKLIFACFGYVPEAALDLAKKHDIDLLSLLKDNATKAGKQESIAQLFAKAIEEGGLAEPVEQAEAETEPQLMRPLRRSAPERFHIINFVWGKRYTDLFLDVTLPNHCTEGNLFAFPNQSDAIYKIYTTSRSAMVIRNHPLFRQITQRMPTQIIALDHLFPPDWEMLDNALLVMTQMHRVAVNAARRDDAHLLILPSDQVYSDGAFRQVIKHARQGYRVVVCAGIRVTKESFVPAFKKEFKQPDDTFPVPARDLVRLALENLHPITRAEFYDADPFSTGPVNLYHRVGDEGYVTHNLHLHVLMIYPRKPVPLKEGNFDTSWLAAACPRFDDYYIVDDSDEIVAIEISEACKSVGLEGDAPLDPARLGTFYRENGTPIHWQFLRQPIFIHTGDLSDQWRKKAEEATAFVESALPLKERIKRKIYPLFPGR